MDSGIHMNYMALNQNILFKPLRFGEGPVEGDQKEPIQSLNDLPVYLNGKHDVSKYVDSSFELTELLNIGHLNHPYAMNGMPDTSGDLTYDFGSTEKYFVVIVRLKLDEGAYGKSEQASDLLALVKKIDVPEILFEKEHYQFHIASSMLFPHLKQLFDLYETHESIIEAGFIVEKESALEELIKQFFENRE